MIDAAPKTGRLTLMSFGFKFGQPTANHVFDVSFLKNPARQEGWSLFSERCDGMRDFVLSQPACQAFLDAVVPVIRVLVQCDDDVRVAFGCSAGRHRSALIAEEVARRLDGTVSRVRVQHREADA